MWLRKRTANSLKMIAIMLFSIQATCKGIENLMRKEPSEIY